jgi:hypothetical protein
MKEAHENCIREVQELMVAINETIAKYGIEDEVIVALAVGFLNLEDPSATPDSKHITVGMNLLSSITVEDEDELEDVLSYVADAYRIEQESNPSNINYWINRMKDNGDIN